MKTSFLMAIAAMILVGAACTRPAKTGPEAALDRAYQAGILSKSEYEAKKAALLASASAPVNAPAPAPAPAATTAPAPAATTAPAAATSPPVAATSAPPTAEPVAPAP